MISHKRVGGPLAEADEKAKMAMAKPHKEARSSRPVIRVNDIRGKDEAEVEEDLREVGGKLFSTIMEVWDTTCENARTRHACHVDTMPSLATRQKTTLY